MFLILFVLRKRQPIGLAMLAGGLSVWLLTGGQVEILTKSLSTVATMPRTYELIFALYFVMCLELQLRLSGTLDGLMSALQHWFKCERLTLVLMPAFLGLLPSLGGARFSAPMVENVGNKIALDAQGKTVINFWFRHVVEYINPINPGLILASAISMIPLSKLIGSMYWVSLTAIVVGWLCCIPRQKSVPTVQAEVLTPQENKQDVKEVSLALAPVVLNFVLIVFFYVNPAIAMGLITLGMFFVLRFVGRPVNVFQVLTEAFDKKLILNVMSIIFFIQILTYTKTLEEVVRVLSNSPLPIAMVVGIISLLIGVLTGISQGHVAMVMPLVAAIAPQDIKLASLALVLGVAGQMITPTHLCFIVTLDYFKADFFKALRPVFVMQTLVVTIFLLGWSFM